MCLNNRSNAHSPRPCAHSTKMRGHGWRTVGIGIALGAFACGAETEGPPDPGADSSATGDSFEVRVEGADVPTFTGTLIVGSSVGPLTNYLLNGTGGSARVQLRGVPLYEVGEFTIDAFTINHRETEMRCSYRSLTAEEPLVLRMEEAGDGFVRGSFSGEVECGPMADDQAGRPATVAVSFTDDVD